MSYDATLTITIPASLYDVACGIARAMDPDSGGAASYGPRTRMDDAGNEVTPDSYTTSTPCTSEFKQQAEYLLTTPAALYQVILKDYKNRWPDLEVPTPQDCNDFCKGVILIKPEIITLMKAINA